MRCTSHDAFHQSSFESVPAFSFTMVSSFNSPFREGRDEKTCALLRSSIGSFLLVEAFQVDVVFVDTFVERADRNASGGCEQGKADIITAQAEGTGGRLVVFDGQYGYLRFPVGGDEADFRSPFHDGAGAVGQLVQDGRIGTQKLRSMGYFLNIRLYLFSLMYASG